MTDPTRTAILDAAENAFKLEPFNRVSVAGVGDAAHASIGAIYHHFGDKEGLRAAVTERLMERLVEGHLRPPFLAEHDPPTVRLVNSTLAYVRFTEEHYDDFALLSSTQHDVRESAHAQRFSRGTIRYVTSIMGQAIDIVREGQETGEIRRGDPGGMVVLVWSALYGMCTLVRRYPGPVRGATGQSSTSELAVRLVHAAISPDAQPAPA